MSRYVRPSLNTLYFYNAVLSLYQSIPVFIQKPGQFLLSGILLFMSNGLYFEFRQVCD